MTAVVDRVTRALAPVVADAGLDLERIEVTPAGRRRVLRVVIDRDGGVTLDDVAALSTRLSQALDDTDAMGDQPYVLEVTSPGLDRPLTLPRHWRRAVGHLVEVAPRSGATVTGRVLQVAEDAVVLDVAGERRTVALADVARARIQVEFRRPADDEA